MPCEVREKDNLTERVSLVKETYVVTSRYQELVQVEELNVGEQVGQEEKVELCKLINEYRDCVAKNIYEIGKTDIVELKIEKTPGSKPVSSKPYKVNLQDRQIIKSIVAEWKEAGIVEETSLPYASQVLLVRKKSGEHSSEDGDWDKYVKKIEQDINTTENKTTEKTPFVRQKIEEAQKKYKDRYDKHRYKGMNYEVGDIVYMKSVPRSTGESTKLRRRYQGPLVVVEKLPSDTYRVTGLMKNTYATTAHVSQLRLWKNYEEKDKQGNNERCPEEVELEERKREQDESEDMEVKDPPEGKIELEGEGNGRRPAYLEDYDLYLQDRPSVVNYKSVYSS
nr:unnamed protein product [Callosobruchus analis]